MKASLFPQIMTSILWAGALFSPELQAESNGLAAVVNGRPITKAEVEVYVRPVVARLAATVRDTAEAKAEIAKARKEGMDDLISRELVLDEYDRLTNKQPLRKEMVEEDMRNYIKETFAGDEKKFLQELKEYGMSLKKFRDLREKGLKLQLMRQEITKHIQFVLPAERAAYKSKYADRFRGESSIKWRAIQIPKIGDDPGSTPESQRQFVKELRTRLVKGADFGSEAKTYSRDSYASEGGDRGWGNSRTVNAQVWAMLEGMKDGAIGEVIEDADSFMIFYVEKKIPGKMKPDAEIEEELDKLVISEKKKEAFISWIEARRAKANIRIY